MTITCPSCRTTMTIPGRYIERKERNGEPVRCTICHWTLIKNEKEADDGNTTSDTN